MKFCDGAGFCQTIESDCRRRQIRKKNADVKMENFFSVFVNGEVKRTRHRN